MTAERFPLDASTRALPFRLDFAASWWEAEMGICFQARDAVFRGVCTWGSSPLTGHVPTDPELTKVTLVAAWGVPFAL